MDNLFLIESYFFHLKLIFIFIAIVENPAEPVRAFSPTKLSAPRTLGKVQRSHSVMCKCVCWCFY